MGPSTEPSAWTGLASACRQSACSVSDDELAPAVAIRSSVLNKSTAGWQGRADPHALQVQLVSALCNSRHSAIHSITSSARTSSEGGTAMRRTLAVLRLITSSNLVGCSTGRSEGFAPLRILST